MKVTLPDSNILATIQPDVLAAHLQAQGWHEIERIYNDAGAIWRRQDNGNAEELEILLPLKQSLGDYTARIREALSTLETVEERSQQEILIDLLASIPKTIITGIVTSVQEGVTAGKITLMGVVVDKLMES